MNELKELTINGNTATIINFPPTFDALAREYAELSRMADELKKEIDAVKAEIIALMDGAPEITGTEHKATYKPVTSTRFDAAACKKDFPELYEAYGKAVTSYRFTFK